MKQRMMAVGSALMMLCLGRAQAEPELKGSAAELSQYLTGVPKMVTVMGEAEVKVPADRAVMTLKVTTENKSLKEALAANQQLRSALTVYLKERGLPADQVQPAKFASTPRHGTFTDKIKSYRIDNEVKVTARDDKEFQSVASALDKWSDTLTYAGVVFEHSDREAQRQKAVGQACDNASARKKTYEDKLGLKLTPKRFGDGPGPEATDNVLTSGLRTSARMSISGGTAPSYTMPTPPEFEESLSAFGELVFKARVFVVYAVESR